MDVTPFRIVVCGCGICTGNSVVVALRACKEATVGEAKG